jgi:hypothetical protein
MRALSTDATTVITSTAEITSSEADAYASQLAALRIAHARWNQSDRPIRDPDDACADRAE